MSQRERKDKCIHELFEEQVKLHPDAVALIFENEELSYQELNQKANQLAHYLVTQKMDVLKFNRAILSTSGINITHRKLPHK